MRKLSLAVAAIIVFISSTSAQVNVGFTGGITLASIKVKEEGFSASSDSKLGFTAGVFLDLPIGNKFSFQPGLNFVQKGGVTKDDGYKSTLNLNYLELPFNFVYTTTEGIFFGAGPALGIGISGKEKESDNGMTDEWKIEFGSDEEQLKRIEFSGNLFGGYRLKSGLMFSVGYNFGFSDLSNEEPDPMFGDFSITNRYAFIRIGYLLNQKAAKK